MTLSFHYGDRVTSVLIFPCSSLLLTVKMALLAFIVLPSVARGWGEHVARKCVESTTCFSEEKSLADANAGFIGGFFVKRIFLPTLISSRTLKDVITINDAVSYDTLQFYAGLIVTDSTPQNFDHISIAFRYLDLFLGEAISV